MNMYYNFTSPINFTPFYDLQSNPKDRNGNKRNHFLFFVLSLVLISKPWSLKCDF